MLLIDLSRIYLGVHNLSHVLTGYAAGGVWLSALITGAETVRRGKNRASVKSIAKDNRACKPR